MIQCEEHSPVLTWNDLQRDIVATHSKEWTLCTGCCCYQPYLQTHDTYGVYLGETRYECDGCIFVPKFHVLDKHRQLKYILRPDTCLGGLCVMPRCGGKGGKCLRVSVLTFCSRGLQIVLIDQFYQRLILVTDLEIPLSTTKLLQEILQRSWED